MYLGGSKKRIRYNVVHPIGQSDLPNQLSLPELTDLLAKHRAGDTDARETLIMSHVRLVLQICGGYVARYPKKKDDIVSAAMIGLVEAVDRMCAHVHNNIGGYITIKVHSAIHKFLSEDHVIRIPQKQIKKMREENILPYTINLHGKVQEDEDNTAYTNDAEISLLPPQYDENDYEIHDFLNYLSTQEQEVLKLRLENHTGRDIAKILRISPARVSQILDDIGKKFTRFIRREANGTGSDPHDSERRGSDKNS